MSNDKKPGYDFVHGFWFWKGRCFSHEACTGLSECVIPTFHMIYLSASFTDTLMRFFWKDELISFPEVTVALASFVGDWNLLPKLAAGCFIALPDHKGHDLTRSSAHDRPNPAFVPSFIDKWPHFIRFQNVFRLSRHKCVFKFRIGFVFFLARKPVSVGWHQRCAGYHAYWSVHGRRPLSALFAPPCIHALVQGHPVYHNPCTSIVGCHWHCARFLQCSGFRTLDMCR